MRLLKIEDVMKKTTLSLKDIINNSSAGKFPSPVPLFDDKEGWVESEVDEWIRVSGMMQAVGEHISAAHLKSAQLKQPPVTRTKMPFTLSFTDIKQKQAVWNGPQSHPSPSLDQIPYQSTKSQSPPARSPP